jgi:hypothetical protein
MRLILEGGAALADPVVAIGQRTALSVDLPAQGRQGTITIDVLDARPDGAVWLLGTLTTIASSAARTVQVELRPFSVPGTHVLTLEQNGRRMPGACVVTVLPARGKNTAAPTRRYLGRGQTA